MKKKIILEINKLSASIHTTPIINDLDLKIHSNEIHIIMGPNGSGKSSLAKILVGHPSLKLEKGVILFNEKNLMALTPEQRANEGLFLAFQYPLEIPGITNYDFLKMAYNKKQKLEGLNELTPLEFLNLVQLHLQELKIPTNFLNRDVNKGFSGGEKKLNEILQMLLLKPKLIILDEIDSGIDLDNIKLLCDVIIKNKESDSSIIIITHNPKLLNYLNANYIHILIKGQIIKTGSLELIETLEKGGYDYLIKKG